jgi:hypothetical protein
MKAGLLLPTLLPTFKINIKKFQSKSREMMKALSILYFIVINDLKVRKSKAMKSAINRPLTPETGVQVPVGLPKEN